MTKPAPSFFRSLVSFEVLTAGRPFDVTHYLPPDCAGGDCSGMLLDSEVYEVGGRAMVKLARQQGSGAAFFDLSEQGCPLADEQPLFRVVVVYEVLSKTFPFDAGTYAPASCLDGRTSWLVLDCEVRSLGSVEMAQLTLAQGSNPEIFGLDFDGKVSV